MRWVILLLILDSVAIFSLLDCTQRDTDSFEGGAEDKKAWTKWLLVAVATGWFGVGYGIVLGYYYAVVKRNTLRN